MDSVALNLRLANLEDVRLQENQELKNRLAHLEGVFSERLVFRNIARRL